MLCEKLFDAHLNAIGCPREPPDLRFAFADLNGDFYNACFLMPELYRRLHSGVPVGQTRSGLRPPSTSFLISHHS